MSEPSTNFKLHVHRVALHSADPRKWYAHIDAWGPEPRAFVNVYCTVPTRTEVNLERGCGCAQAWIAGDVPVSDIRYDADNLYLGTPGS